MTQRSTSFATIDLQTGPLARYASARAFQTAEPYSAQWCLANLPFAGELERPASLPPPVPLPGNDSIIPHVSGLVELEEQAGPNAADEEEAAREERRKMARRLEAKNRSMAGQISEYIQVILQLQQASVISACHSAEQTALPPPVPHQMFVQSQFKEITGKRRVNQQRGQRGFFFDSGYSPGVPTREGGVAVFARPVNKTISKVSTTQPQGRRELDLDELRQEVVKLVESWNEHADLKQLIHALENYKAAVAKLSDSLELEGVLSGLKAKVRKSRYLPNGRSTSPVQTSQANLRKRTQNESERVWARVDDFFLGITQEVVTDLERLNAASLRTDSGKAGLLNMYAVNRLAAILKMIKYCNDMRIDLPTFHTIAVDHRLNGLKLARGANVAVTASYFIAPGELKYLAALPAELDSETARLASLLLSTEQNAGERDNAELKERLRKVAQRNVELRSRMMGRITARREVPRPLPDSSGLEKKYRQLIPAMKRRRAKELKREKNAANEVEDRHTEVEGTHEPASSSHLAGESDSEYEMAECGGDRLGTFEGGTRATPGSVMATPPVTMAETCARVFAADSAENEVVVMDSAGVGGRPGA